MAQGKVEICGVNTSKLPLLKNAEKEELFSKFIDKENNVIYLLYDGTKTKESNELMIKRDFIKEMFSNTRQLPDTDENGVSISFPIKLSIFSVALWHIILCQSAFHV